MQSRGAMRKPVVLWVRANFSDRSREYMEWGGQEMQLVGEGLRSLTLQ